MKDLPLISYERSMNHNYMVLSSPDFFGTSKTGGRGYRERMLLENHIPGLLPITHRQSGGESRYYYEINSLQPLDRMIEKNELKYSEFKALIAGCIKLFDRLEEYLLGGNQILLSPEFIFVNVQSMEPYFVCYPAYEGDARLAFMEFIDMLLPRIDHTDEQAVLLGYQVYRYTRNPNYVLSEIYKFMEESTLKQPKKSVKPEPQSMDVTPDMCADVTPDISGSAAQSRTPNNSFIYEESAQEEESSGRRGDIKELIGGIFCVLVALCAVVVIFCARVLCCIKLTGSNELYMYCAAAMAAVSAALFFVCYRKSMQGGEADEPDDEYGYEMPDIGSIAAKPEKTEAASVYKEPVKPAPAQEFGETVALGDGMAEEKLLRGRVNGREVNVPLDHLPLTVGKLGSVSDYIIDDNAVSKMHARFEEHGGRVCVCDLNSTNGTLKNGEPIGINIPVALEPGDKLRIGRSSFIYC